jgi:hypothetical protein
VVGLEGSDVVDREEVVGVLGGFGGLVDDDGGADEPAEGDAGDVLAVAAGDPMDRASKWVPTCSPMVRVSQAQAGPRSS